MVNGSVNNVINGFIKTFTTPRTTATRTAVQNVSTTTPGRIYAAIKTANPLMIKYASKFMLKD